MIHELVLGGQKSGKSRLAEERAAHWLEGSGHRAALLATGEALDEEMRQRIERHRRDRARRLPALVTIEVTDDLPGEIVRRSSADVLLIVDCLTLWLTRLLMPMTGTAAENLDEQINALLNAVQQAHGPVVLISNEIAMGVIPMEAETRAFVDTLATLHQRLARSCQRVTLMVAGCELTMKGAA